MVWENRGFRGPQCSRSRNKIPMPNLSSWKMPAKCFVGDKSSLFWDDCQKVQTRKYISSLQRSRNPPARNVCKIQESDVKECEESNVKECQDLQSLQPGLYLSFETFRIIRSHAMAGGRMLARDLQTVSRSPMRCRNQLTVPPHCSLSRVCCRPRSR